MMMHLIPWRRKHAIPTVRITDLATPFSGFRRDMDRLFDRVFEPWGWWADTGWPTAALIPSVDVAESDDHITIRAEIPGMAPEDVEIDLSGNLLTIHGEKRESKEDETDDCYHCERRFGSFTRTIELPADADVESIEAEGRDGVLTIRVGKIPARKARKIDVKRPQRELLSAD
jgi:HSP20 family protein